MKARTIVTIALAMAAVAVEAQSDSPKSLVITRTTTSDSLILAKDRQLSPQDIPVPKFVVKTRDNSFMLTIGGKINPIMGVDLGNNLYEQNDAGINFITQQIPVPAVRGHKSDFFINPLNAAIDFQIVGLTGTPDQITGYVKIGTNGISKALKLSKAYVSWRGITTGLKSTLMKDDDACQPPTIDPQGPSGCLSTGVYELGFKSKKYNGWQFAVGIDMPTWYSSNGVYRGKDYPEFDGKQVSDYADAEQMIPDIPMWLQYQISDNNRVRISAILRNFAYRDLVSDKTRHLVGWGAMLSGNLSTAEPLVFYYQAVYGKGIGAYLQDISGLPLSFVPTNATPGHMDASPMMGVNLGLSYNIGSRWQVNAMASESRIWNVSDYASQENTTNYKYALYAAANAFYKVTDYLQWGVEYVWGRRVTWNMGAANDSRLQTQLLFTF